MTEKSFEEPPSATGNNEGAMNRNENTGNDGNTKQSTNSDDRHILKDEILNFLSENNEINFKSQQIDDPELTINEKKQIASEILEKDHGKFLIRFGRYLQNEHLNYFEKTKDCINDEKMNIDDENEKDYEVKFLLKDLRKNLEHKQKNIKNRRYAAMQALIKENNYFSEKEMMQREPHLYEQLVGQYLTESEKRIRDSYDPKNTTFSNIVFDTIDKERMNELRKKQENDEEQMSDLDDTVSQCSFRGGGNSSKTTSEIGTPPAYRKQWGNFDNESDNRDQPTTSNENNEKRKYYKRKNEKQQQKLITAGEREMLRQEFIGIMYSKFLEGEDKDFDYSKVDENSDLDDLKQINQDNEDKYFDGSDDDDNDDLDTTSYREIIDRIDDDMESEDELDTYMKHLSKHPALKKCNDEEEEEEEKD